MFEVCVESVEATDEEITDQAIKAFGVFGEEGFESVSKGVTGFIRNKGKVGGPLGQCGGCGYVSCHL
jgi:hypothetical protein